jgi:hypothetical protein
VPWFANPLIRPFRPDPASGVPPAPRGRRRGGPAALATRRYNALINLVIIRGSRCSFICFPCGPPYHFCWIPIRVSSVFHPWLKDLLLRYFQGRVFDRWRRNKPEPAFRISSPSPRFGRSRLSFKTRPGWRSPGSKARGREPQQRGRGTTCWWDRGPRSRIRPGQVVIVRVVSRTGTTQLADQVIVGRVKGLLPFRLDTLKLLSLIDQMSN